MTNRFDRGSDARGRLYTCDRILYQDFWFIDIRAISLPPSFQQDLGKTMKLLRAYLPPLLIRLLSTFGYCPPADRIQTDPTQNAATDSKSVKCGRWGPPVFVREAGVV